MEWREAYRLGYRAAVLKLQKQGVAVDVEEFMKGIDTMADGAPSYYAVANHCCGGVDAHSIDCRHARH